jgi:NTE family protein
MNGDPSPLPPLKYHTQEHRPPFERIALLLQGGGALGSYQAGVYQALAEANLHPDWVAGISIGAINAAVIAGNAPDRRVEKLRALWEAISTPPLGIPSIASLEGDGPTAHRYVNQFRAMGAILWGAPNFFRPRVPPPYLLPRGTAESTSYYDIAPMKETLERLVDFDRINSPGAMQFSCGAVNVKTGNFAYFDSTTHKIRAEHVMASGALPPGFPYVEVDGEYYWDGGLVSNTPLQWVLDSRPRKDTLAFQVDLWDARGQLPQDLDQSDLRQKEIRYSSRTRAGLDQFKQAQHLRRALAMLLKELPPEQLARPYVQTLCAEADETVYNLVQLIYHANKYEGTARDYEFSRRTMEEHWAAGHRDAVQTLRHPEVLQRPKNPDGVFTFDLIRDGRD